MQKNLLLNSKVFIAGHKGMVGSAIFRKLDNLGYKNIITVTKKDLNLEDANKVRQWFENYKPDIVIIAAAKVGGINANNKYPVDFLLKNLKIQNNLIEASWLNNVNRLLFLGSSCIYPKFSTQPIKEEYLLTGELEPTNEWYALAKIAGIKLCQALRKQYGFDAISLMPTNLYGPGDNYNLSSSHVLPALIRKFYEGKENNLNEVTCWGTGNPRREFLHVDDLAEAVVFVLKNWHPSLPEAPKDSRNQTLPFLNVGTGNDISIKELANLIAKEIGYCGKIIWDQSKPDGMFRKQLDVSNIINLGWEPKIKFSDGIKDSIIGFKNELKTNTLRI
ncbi:NAD dependent epimerase/dehydratase [Prochlorococcus marinus str. MIT 9312]|uniref:GDP-L-fucose synthase n=1 Tax=Prochlorococcus marinus (strain MIT 9312) TaxID=74546 RepID=Q319S1_PROM9|nr:GDP-L-fucose synthase [Prochlorococcus marinus]ABB50374.1 NAD dependent epimerase/dehydratase [Prochlorococcus marinus str. MIT 9312]KGF99968.1 GDP-L-fucose synthetase [Prochlorococcus marinus str. MIT 9311]